MKNKVFYVLSLLTLTVGAIHAQTVIKMLFQQPERFTVSLEKVIVYIPEEETIERELGLEVEVNGGKGGYSYTWEYNGNTVGEKSTLYIDKLGEYYLYVKDENECQLVVYYLVTDNPDGINKEVISAVVVYPNPTNGAVYIKLPVAEEINQISLHQYDGRLVKLYRKENMAMEGNILKLDISALSLGQYLLSLQFGEKIITKSIILQ